MYHPPTDPKSIQMAATAPLPNHRLLHSMRRNPDPDPPRANALVTQKPQALANQTRNRHTLGRVPEDSFRSLKLSGFPPSSGASTAAT